MPAYHPAQGEPLTGDAYAKLFDDKLATTLLAVLACVILFEITSAALRAMRPRVSALLLAVAAPLGSALLAISWGDLFTSAAVDQTRAFLAGFAHPNSGSAFLSGASW